MMTSLRLYARDIVAPIIAMAMVLATVLTVAFYQDASAATSCYARNAYRPYVTDPPGSGNAQLVGEVYLECSTYDNRTVSAYLMEDLYYSSDAQIQRYTYADYDWWHSRTARYGALGYYDDGDTQEYYTRLRFYDAGGGQSGNFDSSRLATHYTWRP